MKLEGILKPVKYVDEEILRWYTKKSVEFKIDKGRRKYFAGFGLGLLGAFLSIHALYNNGLGLLDRGLFTFCRLNDGLYNVHGIFFGDKEDQISGVGGAADELSYNCKQYNTAVRLPTILAGVGLVGKFGLDLCDRLVNSTPISNDSTICLYLGTSFLSTASSMYIKSSNPKLLEKQPAWKKVFEKTKEKIKEYISPPIPQPAQN